MRTVLILSLLALVLPMTGLTPAASAADPIACRQLNAGLTEEQRLRLDRWLRQERPGGDFTIDYTCNVDGRRAVVAVADYNGLASAAYVGDFSGSTVKMRRLAEGRIEAPVIFSMPGGGRSLVYTVQHPDRGLMLRTLMATDLADGATQTLHEAHFDSRQRGCQAASGVVRLLIAIAARPVDADKDGNPDIVVDREQQDCTTGKTDRRELVFLATPEGFRPRP